MKRLFYLALALVAFATSCGKDQSSYSLESISDYATVMGTLHFNEGYKSLTIDGKSAIIENYTTPAAEQTILVTVGYDQYKSGQSGDKIYETTTDSLGKFSIDIPVVQSTAISVSYKPFMASHSIEFNEMTVVMEQALYNVGGSSSDDNVAPYDVKSFALVAQTSQSFSSEDIALPITVKGDIRVRSEKLVETPVLAYEVIDHYTYSVATDYSAMASTTATLIFSNPNDSYGRVIKYPVTSGADGTFSFDALLFSEWEYNNVTVTMERYSYSVASDNANAFTHYYILETDNTKYNTQKLGGIYSFSSSEYDQLEVIMAGGDTVPDLTLTLAFNPFDGTEIFGVNNLNGYVDTNVLGWVVSL